MKPKKIEHKCFECNEIFDIVGRIIVTRIKRGYKGREDVFYHVMCPKCGYCTYISAKELPLWYRWKLRKNGR